MDDLQKAALLLKHLSPEERAHILIHLDAAQRLSLEQMIDAANDISHDELVHLVSEYQDHLRELQTTVNSRTISEQTVESVEETKSYLTDSRDVVWLKAILIHESTAVQAAVLCHIHEETARQLFEEFSEEQQQQLLERLPHQEALSPLAWEELSLCLREKDSAGKSGPKPGHQLLSRLVNDSESSGIVTVELTEAEQRSIERTQQK